MASTSHVRVTFMRQLLVAAPARRAAWRGRGGALVLLLVAFLLPNPPVGATEPRLLAWSELMPEALTAAGRIVTRKQERIWGLPAPQREVYERVAEELLLREKLAAEGLAKDKLSERDRELLDAKLSEKHPDVTRELTELRTARLRADALSSATEPSLNGTSVRIPGYVLPLEFDGDLVSEFLLVPFVGACIHVPAPPPNQMVLVKTTESIKIKKLYDPVWVEGVLSTKGETRRLSLVDGQAPVDAGYSLGATRVTPYTR